MPLRFANTKPSLPVRSRCALSSKPGAPVLRARSRGTRHSCRRRAPGTARSNHAFSGGSNFEGVIFRMTAHGVVTTLYSFCAKGSPFSDCLDGRSPLALIQGRDGDFYGTTLAGGSSHDGGTVFKVTPSGTLTTLHSFCAKGTSTPRWLSHWLRRVLLGASDADGGRILAGRRQLLLSQPPRAEIQRHAYAARQPGRSPAEDTARGVAADRLPSPQS